MPAVKDMLVPRRSASHGEAGYERKERDFYPTEPWVTRALCDAVDLRGDPTRPGYGHVWEPACGDGRMAKVLCEAGYNVTATDLFDYGYGLAGVDFLECQVADEFLFGAIVTNPPFGKLSKQFIIKSLEMTRRTNGIVVILQRHEFDAPRSNHYLFSSPFSAKLILPRRPRWFDENKASPRFPYAWYVWDWRHKGPPIIRYLPDVKDRQ